MTWRTAWSAGAPVVVRVWRAGWQGAVCQRGMLGANPLGQISEVARAEAVRRACALYIADPPILSSSAKTGTAL